MWKSLLHHISENYYLGQLDGLTWYTAMHLIVFVVLVIFHLLSFSAYILTYFCLFVPNIALIKPPRATWHDTLPFSESFLRRHSWIPSVSVSQSERGWPRWLALIGREPPEGLKAGTTVPRLLITPHYDDGGIAEGALTRKDCVTDVGIHLIWQL